jgi:NAD-dependent deacetylase sirtuin 4
VQHQQPHRTPPGVPAAAPPAEPISRQALETLAALIADSSSMTVLTGAGCSTESHIPDYRGPTGAYTTGAVCR